MIDEETDSNLPERSEDIRTTTAIRVDRKELIPDGSKDKYDKVYNVFQTWRQEQNISELSEDVFSAYFLQLSKKYSPSTLWSWYSMLRTTLSTYDNVEIINSSKIRAFIKKENIGYKKKKSKVFTSDEVERFLFQAPDDQWLAIKAVFVVGIFGACRSCELVDLTVNRVQRQGDVFLFSVQDTQTLVERSFVIRGEHALIIEKYRALRPQSCDSEKFFVSYRNGKCVNQNIGKNTIGSYPRRIAQYLKLETPNLYTGHSYRQTAMKLFANSEGAYRFGFEGWESECC